MSRRKPEPNKNIAQAGFTLIEMLVVVSIISLLSSIVLSSAVEARRKARDAKRLADMAQIQKALDLYYNNNNSQYPGDTASYGEDEITNGCGTYDTSAVDKNGNGNKFIDPLVTAGVVKGTPVDPINEITNNVSCSGTIYRYYKYPAGSYGCDSGRGDFYVLQALTMETGPFPHPSSPGWSCPGRNWQIEGYWVTGRFER
ncbi:MAG: prepilin-type N-terminal cleavage/methylation domain-containing protein [Candidatus Doudnabacteria bacterium]|nr:prepilin-type N-terminal cleavage/methylation domain-containing protein [Candidatus Doudnabacteria bacterium]